MKPIKFADTNHTYAADQPQYLALPCWKASRAKMPEGAVITCWRLSLWERLVVLFTGKIWHSQLGFHEPLQPVLMEVESPMPYYLEYYS